MASIITRGPLEILFPQSYHASVRHVGRRNLLTSDQVKNQEILSTGESAHFHQSAPFVFSWRILPNCHVKEKGSGLFCGGCSITTLPSYDMKAFLYGTLEGIDTYIYIQNNTSLGTGSGKSVETWIWRKTLNEHLVYSYI